MPAFQSNAFQYGAFQTLSSDNPVYPDGIVSAQAFGTAVISQSGTIAIQVVGISSSQSFGILTAYSSGEPTYGLAVYGTGQKYGAGHKYGRIDPLISYAQSQPSRTTGLKIIIRDSFPNKWEYVTGTPIVPVDWTIGQNSTSQFYFGYRWQMAMCVLGNGTIVRVRVGNGDPGDYNIYKQEITNPLTASQWTTWTLAYSGSHYAVAVSPATISTYNIYASKYDGIYRNNSLVSSRGSVIKLIAVPGLPEAMYVVTVSAHTDKRRILDVYYTPDITITEPFYDDNFDWIRTEISAWNDGSSLYRAQVAAFHSDPRSPNVAESLVVGKANSTAGGLFTDPPRLVRGFASQAGHNAITNPYLIKLSDGFYYLFYSEARYDASKDKAINLSTIFWQRSKDLKFWSEPIAIGFDDMTPTGFSVVETAGYIWLANNGAVYRRPVSYLQEYELSDYVSEVSLELPRGNEEGTGSFTVANPSGVNDAIKDFTDKEVDVQLGIKASNGIYKYTQFGKWWVHSVDQERDGQVNRLPVKLYDLWRRLDVPLRDTYSFIGQVDWEDFAPGNPNQLFNYYPRSCKATVKKVTPTNIYVQVSQVTTSSFLLYTGWKGHNGIASMRVRGGTPEKDTKIGLVIRYQDAKNYLWVYYHNKYLKLVQVVAGKATELDSQYLGALGNPTINARARWDQIDFWVTGKTVRSKTISHPFTKPGYTGVRATGIKSYTFDRFKLTSWETPYTTSDLIRTALAMGDFHDVVVAGGEDPQLAVVWGPQTDLKTPAAALRSLLEQYKLDLVWHNGQIHVGQFKNLNIVKTLSDEIISSEAGETAGQHINLAVVDGQEDTYIEIDGPDTRERGRQIPNYFDLPELKNYDSVRARAREEVRKGVVATSLTGSIVLLFDLYRMDAVLWTEPDGTTSSQRIEGMTINANQGLTPYQRMDLDMSPLS